ncbi:MAG: NUDIX hydrolase [Patescibacteria group bacterium]
MFKKIIISLNIIIFPLVKLYWFIFRPETSGTKCIIEYKNRVLFIRNNYGRKRWTFPGGRINKGEIPEQTIKREIKEEVGLDISDLKLLDIFISTAEYKKDKVYLYLAKSNKKDLIIDNIEILQAKWLNIDNYPKPIGQIALKMIKIYNKK